MKDNTDCTNIWSLYQKGVDQHRAVNMYDETEKEHDFYIGEQWRGVKAGNEELPVLNFIKPVIKYKVSMIAQTLMRIVYTSMAGEQTAQVCEKLTKYADAQWEKLKMDTVSWRIIKNAAIAGDHYVYCFDAREPSESVVDDMQPKLKVRMVDKTNVYFSDEQNREINEQEWIILSERVPVSKVRRIAKKNGMSDAEIEMIVSDEDTDDDIGQDTAKEVETRHGKCTSLLYMQLTDSGLKFCRSTQGVIYQPEKEIQGLDVYPLVSFLWEEKKGDSRGASAVKSMISNQIEVNRIAARRSISVKRHSFPVTVIDGQKIENAGDLDKPGAIIKINDLGNNQVAKYIQYLNPAPISGDAANLQNEMIDRTQTLEGAGDAALGQVNPENASGEAIKAARDQAAVPLNEQVSAYKQFVEDIAMLWYKLWVVYSPFGMRISYEDAGGFVDEIIPQNELRVMDMGIKIEVSPVDPYSKLSQEMALGNMLAGQYITFEEYIDALSDTSTVPKAKIKAILDAREQQAAAQQILSMNSMPQQALPEQTMPEQVDPRILAAMQGGIS